MAYGKINVESAVSGGSGLPTQLVNYTMLYDGSLGVSGSDGANACIDITGGWTGTAFSTNFAYSFNSNCVTLGSDANGANDGMLRINNTLNLNDYALVGVIAKLTSVSQAYSRCGLLINNVGFGPMNETYGSLGSTSGFKRYCGTNLCVHVGEFVEATSNDICLMNRFAVGEIYGAFFVKDDNWQEWISKAGLSTDTYTTLDAVIADSTALTTLMNNEDAVKYMLLNCTGTVIASVIQSDTALDIIADSDYISNILANVHWKKFLDMVGFKPRTYLYKNGIEYEAIETESYTLVDSTTSNYQNWKEIRATTMTSNYINITATTSSTYSTTGDIIGTQDKISFSRYEKLCVVYEYDGETLRLDLDVANITGDYYVSFAAYGLNDVGYQNFYTRLNVTSSKTGAISKNVADVFKIFTNAFTSSITVKIHRIWLE